MPFKQLKKQTLAAKDQMAPKIALLTDGIPPYIIGGMQKHSLCLARELLRCGAEVTLVHCVNYGAKAPDANEVRTLFSDVPAERLESICLRFPKPGVLPGHYLRESWEYADTIDNTLKNGWSSFDFIYAKGFTAWKLLDLKRKGKGANMPPIAVNFHGYEMYQSAPDKKSKFQQYLLKGPVRFNNLHADYVFSYGGKITEIIRSIGVPEDRIIEMPTGIESDWISQQVGQTSESIRFLFVGRYERRKGIEELHEVLKTLPAELDLRVDFVGPIPISKRLSDPRFNYHGAVKEKDAIRDIYDTADVLICPSHSEGMPNVIMEALGRGLAVIATDVGAVCDQVDESVGWLIPPRDSFGLKEAILQAATCNPQDILEKKRQALTRCNQQFTWEVIGRRTCESIEQVVSISEK